MYPVFVSDGLVLGKRGTGEESTSVAILTREHGLLRASARAARRENSKLRYGLEMLTQAEFSFIRGKYEWKLTGAQDISRALMPTSAPGRQAAGRIARLLQRLVQGEEPSVELFETVTDGFTALARGIDVEAVLVLKMLSRLGYIPDTSELKPFIEKDFFALELVQEVEASRKLLIKAINESLSATGL